jgi:dinuclear metal center YbgI/SA1388 family protein
MKVIEVIRILEDYVPVIFQESYDNCGLQVGNAEEKVSAVLCTLDITPAVIDEAIGLGANLIVSHHPLIFEPLTSLTGKDSHEMAVIKAIQHNISLYAAHTNLDNSRWGINHIIAVKLGLTNYEILSPLENFLYKLVTFVPYSHAVQVREALFAAGAGHIGNYDCCSYNIKGEGTFRAGDNTNPFLGEIGKLHSEGEIRIETIVPKDKIGRVIQALKRSHPYEEVAYDLYPLVNEYSDAGAGVVGDLKKSMTAGKFLGYVKTALNLPVVRYAGELKGKIRRIAFCGGAGSFLLHKAIYARADAYLTGDIKYHKFFEAENKILLCDIGHYESEQFANEIFYNLLNKKISTFAVHLSKVVTNPIKYFF